MPRTDFINIYGHVIYLVYGGRISKSSATKIMMATHRQLQRTEYGKA